MYSIAGVLKAGNAVAKDDFAAPVDPVKDELGKLATRQAHIAPARERTEDVDAKAAHPASAIIDKAKLADMVALLRERGEKPHPLGDIITETPKVDNVAVRPRRSRPLGQCWPIAPCTEPIGERRSGDSND